jgi:predicted ATPase/DNA-binding winged helix-turn-helix (wHTH) protein
LRPVVGEGGGPVVLRFANCELDLARVVLRRDGREVKVEPQVFDVLAYLAQHRGTVVRKEELLDEVWGDRFVSESALTTRIKSVRQAVGDDGRRQAIVRTVHGKGYEFVAAVEEVERLPAAPGPPAAAAPGPSVPAAVQPLIGREPLLDRLEAELAAKRLVTLVGPGGVGKTVVGFELARRMAAGYPDGVHVVELVGVADEDATVAALATALEVNERRTGSIEDAVVDVLRARRCLLVLDNCEHLVEPVATLVTRVLRDAPGVSVVATSRERLAVAGEHVWAVEPLSTAGSHQRSEHDLAAVPAVALFVERAQAADAAFTLDARTAPVVAELCRRLDGIPLAIELAAARARSIGVEEIAERLDERFVLLKATRRGSDPRHRTLHDAISWSYDLLSDDEQQLFQALSVFAGPFELASAEAVCPAGDALDLLARLTERSMVSVRRPPEGGTRYELLETLREYGRARMDDDRSIDRHRAHATHLATVAQGVEADLRGPGEAAAVARAEGSFADLRAAQRFALDSGDLDTALRIVGSLREYGMRALRYEVFAWADAATRAPGALEHPRAPLALGIRAYGAWVRGEFDLAVEVAREARALEERLGVAPSGLVERVLINVLCLDARAGIGAAESIRQVELAEASGDRSRLVHASYMRAVVLSSMGEYDQAVEAVARARAEAERTGSPTDLASAAVAEGFVTHGDDRAALEAFRVAERLAAAAGNRWMRGFAQTEASGLLVHGGQLALGCEGLAEMVDVWFRAGEWSQQWHTLSRCVIALHRMGSLDLAAEVVGAIEAHALLGVAPMSPTLRQVVFEVRQAIVDGLGEDRTEERLRVGATRPVVETVDRTRRALLGRPVSG